MKIILNDVKNRNYGDFIVSSNGITYQIVNSIFDELYPIQLLNIETGQIESRYRGFLEMKNRIDHPDNKFYKSKNADLTLN